MSLSCHIFVIDHTLSFGSWMFSSNFNIDRTYRINCIVLLYGLHHRPYPIRSIILVQFHFQCRFNLYDRSRRWPSRLRHRPHTIYLVLIVPYRILWRSHMYDRSRHCSLCFSWLTASYPIGHDNLVTISTYTTHVRSITSFSYVDFVIDYT